MTGTQILEAAGRRIDDDIDTVEGLKEINIALQNLSVEAPFERYVEVTITANTSVADLPAEFISLCGIGCGGSFLTCDDAPELRDSSVTGTPTLYHIYRDVATGQSDFKIQVYPTPTVNTTLKIRFMSGYGSLASLADSPLLLPDIYHELLICYVAMVYKAADEDLEGVALWSGKLNEGKDRLIISVQTLNGYQAMRGDESNVFSS